MVTTNEEQQVEDTEVVTTRERKAPVQAAQELLIDVVRENGWRSDESYKALNAKKDRLMYLTLGVRDAVLVGIVKQPVSKQKFIG